MWGLGLIEYTNTSLCFHCLFIGMYTVCMYGCNAARKGFICGTTRSHKSRQAGPQVRCRINNFYKLESLNQTLRKKCATTAIEDVLTPQTLAIFTPKALTGCWVSWECRVSRIWTIFPYFIFGVWKIETEGWICNSNQCSLCAKELISKGTIYLI